MSVERSTQQDSYRGKNLSLSGLIVRASPLSNLGRGQNRRGSNRRNVPIELNGPAWSPNTCFWGS